MLSDFWMLALWLLDFFDFEYCCRTPLVNQQSLTLFISVTMWPFQQIRSKWFLFPSSDCGCTVLWSTGTAHRAKNVMLRGELVKPVRAFWHSIIVNVTWPRLDQLTDELVVGHTTNVFTDWGSSWHLMDSTKVWMEFEVLMPVRVITHWSTDSWAKGTVMYTLSAVQSL